MIEAWLDFPLWLAIPATLLSWLATLVSLWWLFQRSRLTPFWRSCQGVVAPFFASVATLFGISVGFMGADIWQRTERAQQAVLQEASTINLLTHFASALGPDEQSVTVPVCAYAKAVVQQEWTAMVEEGQASPATEATLDHLMLLLVSPELTAQVDAPLRREMLNAANQIRQYRVTRIQLSGSHSNTGKWLLLLFLGFMTQVAISVVHLDKPRAQALALSIFTTAMAVTLLLMAGMDQPFTSPFAVSPAPIAELAGCH